jgi:hypothetical protein
MEVKKDNNTKKEGELFDLLKLLTLTTAPKFNYKYGYFIELPIRNTSRTFNSSTPAFPNSSHKKVYKVLPIK